jgi:DNA polymerase III delta prime subunit
VFEIEPPSKKDVAVYVRNILDKETIKYELPDLKIVLDNFYPDIRKVINYLQQSSTSGSLKLVKTQNTSVDLKSRLINLLKNSKTNSNTFNDIRQLVADAGTKTFDELYIELYDKASEFALDKEIFVIIEVAEYMYQSAMVVDKEITFMACIAKLIKTVNK